MDFHTLTRRQLQTLCKKNKIPANITNVAMADALSALPMVEGMEELSPEKSLPATGGGASTCRTITNSRPTRSVIKDESDETLHLSTIRTTTRRSTRKDVVHQMRQTPAKMEALDFAGIQEEEEEEGAENGGDGIKKCSLPHQTPAHAVAPASRQLGLNLKDGETTLTRAQGTRRSTRLAVKNAQGNNNKNNSNPDDYQRSERVAKKMDFEEIVKGGPDCSACCDVDLVTESFGGIDLNKKADVGLEKSKDAGALTESDRSAKKHNESEVKHSQGPELVEPKMVVDANGDGAGRNICNNVSKDGDVTGTEETLEIGEEVDTNIHVATKDQNDAFSAEIGTNVNMSKEEEEVESKQDVGQSHNDVDISQTEARINVIEDEKEVQSLDFVAKSVDDEKQYRNSEEDMDVAAVVESEEVDSRTEEQDVGGIIEPPAIETSPAREEEVVTDNLAEKFNAMELIDFGVDHSSISEEGFNNTTSMEVSFDEYSTKPRDAIAADVAADHSTVTQPPAPTIIKYLSPVKKEEEVVSVVSPLSQKCCVSKSGNKKRMMIHQVSDDKENNIMDMVVHSNSGTGTKPMMITSASAAKEKNGKMDIFLFKESRKPLEETSLRKLKKELKSTLLMKANNNHHHDDSIKAAAAAAAAAASSTTTRPALQALSENRPQISDSS